MRQRQTSAAFQIEVLERRIVMERGDECDLILVVAYSPAK
jgi:hypothetical protein